MPHKYLLNEFEEFARLATSAQALMGLVSQRIHLHIPRYNWIGFYLIDEEDPAVLVLGPHAGSFTPLPRISFDQGLCGLAASTGRVTVADNVAQDPRYPQASDLVKSQICAPVVVRGSAVGVLNVESYFLATFRASQEREFVETCARLVGRYLEKTVATDFVNV